MKFLFPANIPIPGVYSLRGTGRVACTFGRLPDLAQLKRQMNAGDFFFPREPTHCQWCLMMDPAIEPIATMRECGGWLEKVVLPWTVFTITKPFLMA
jgi:hypothetical protein